MTMNEDLQNQPTPVQDVQNQDQGEQKVPLLVGFLSSLAEFVRVFVIAAAIILPIRLFLIQPFYVKGESMEPNFYESEYLIIDKLTPYFKAYKRGEVIVFRHPKTERHYLIKRLIGLPGERVEIKDRKITIYNKDNPQGFVLNETDYGPRLLRDEPDDVILNDSQYFVLGDNRPVSLDSERFGPIGADQIVGRVAFRGLPIDRASFFSVPKYDNTVTSN